MSYTIVKQITVDKKNKKVYLTGASNNVYPRTYYKEEMPDLSKLAEKELWNEIDLIIFKEYETGNLQGGINKYTKALEILHYATPEYEKFNWRQEDYQTAKKRRQTPEFEKLLKEVLNSKLAVDKFVLSRVSYSGQKIYGKHKKGSGIIRWTNNINKATKFNFEKQIKILIKNFVGMDNCKIEKIS